MRNYTPVAFHAISRIHNQFNVWVLAMKAAIVGISGPELTEAERSLFAHLPPAGIILFSRNIQSPTQLQGLVADLRRALPADAVLMLDQEGGRVARLGAPHWPALPSAATLGALWTHDPAEARITACKRGMALGLMAQAAGIDVITAPVLDVPVLGSDKVIGDRAISTDPVAVGVLGADIAAGILSQGVQPVMKHIPGHGRATIDSHVSLPRVATKQLDQDLAPFVANARLPWAMTAHIVYEAWDAVRPATVSPRVIEEVIRRRIGFQGILVSDDLAMGAMTGDPASRARDALAAGCDLALFCSGDLILNQTVLEAAFVLSAARAAEMKFRQADLLATDFAAAPIPVLADAMP